MEKIQTKQNRKRKAESNAYKAFSHYIAIRRKLVRGQATIQQVAHALALVDITSAVAFPNNG
jgi:hypothetical protein